MYIYLACISIFFSIYFYIYFLFYLLLLVRIDIKFTYKRMLYMIYLLYVVDEVGCSNPDLCEDICSNPSGCSNIAYPLLVVRILPTGIYVYMINHCQYLILSYCTQSLYILIICIHT